MDSTVFVLMILSRTARSAAAFGGLRSLTRSSTRTNQHPCDQGRHAFSGYVDLHSPLAAVRPVLTLSQQRRHGDDSRGHAQGGFHEGPDQAVPRSRAIAQEACLRIERARHEHRGGQGDGAKSYPRRSKRRAGGRGGTGRDPRSRGQWGAGYSSSSSRRRASSTSSSIPRPATIRSSTRWSTCRRSI